MYKYVFLAVIMGFVAGCKESKDLPDVSAIAVDIKITRADEDLLKVNSKDALQQLITQDSAFYMLYTQEIFPMNRASMDSFYMDVTELKQDTIFIQLAEKVSKKYPKLDDVQAQLKSLFQYLIYYFPDQVTVPNFYTFISEFAYQVFIFEDNDGKDAIGLGLDMFIYPDMNYKSINPDNTNFSDYITRTWNRDHIARKVADIYITNIAGQASGMRLLDQMIHNGKMLYLTTLVMPTTSDTIIHEWTPTQLAFCKDSELEMWTFFLNEKLIYETNPGKISKYINPSPSSPDMPLGAPGRTANYLGLQIIRSYMDRYPETTLTELIQMNDSQKLLELSKYKPKQKK